MHCATLLLDEEVGSVFPSSSRRGPPPPPRARLEEQGTALLRSSSAGGVTVAPRHPGQVETGCGSRFREIAPFLEGTAPFADLTA